MSEVSESAQQTALSNALSQGIIDLTSITDQAELKRLSTLNTFLGIGESAAIAIAESRGWLIAMDEGGKVGRTVREGPCKNRLITTPGIMLPEFAPWAATRDSKRHNAFRRASTASRFEQKL